MSIKSKYIYFLMTLPAVILFFIFHTYPVLQGIYYSFTNWKGYGEYHFVGFKNFINVFKDEFAMGAYGFTFKYAIISTILVNIISLVIALGLNAKIRFKNGLRTIFFLPNILSIIIVGYIFNYFFAYLVPDIAQHLGIHSLERSILGQESYAWIGVVIVSVWQGVAFNTILYLAGLQTIQQDFYEASSLDGASQWQNFWYITFPLIAPFFTINMVLAMRNFLQAFDQIFSLTGGGPGRATTSVAMYIYRGGFEGGQFAYQSANSVIFFVVIAVISIVQVRFLQKREVDMG